MDTNKLVAALDEVIAQDRPIEEKIFLRLLKEIWQVDWTVAPYDIWVRMMRFDMRYFVRFMAVDDGDEADEDTLIKDWISFRRELGRIDQYPRTRIMDLTEEANRIRMNAQIE